jgi:hypothetical protein
LVEYFHIHIDTRVDIRVQLIYQSKLKNNLACKYIVATYELLPPSGVNFPTIQNDMQAQFFYLCFQLPSESYPLQTYYIFVISIPIQPITFVDQFYHNITETLVTPN